MSSGVPTHASQNARLGFFHLHQHKKPVDAKRKVALLISYAPDWVMTLLIAGLFFLLNNIEPFKREFSLNDASIQHSYAVHERISDANLLLIALVAPLVLMAFVNAISIRSPWDFHISCLGAILAMSLTGTITNIVKVTVGRPRPDCIDRCQPRPDSVDQSTLGLVNASICTQTDNYILKDGFRSFPSGHSSLSFAGLGFLSFYLAGKLHLFDEKGHTGKAWISLIPLIGAALVAISRTMDYRHHWHDVLVGSLLGLFLAWFSYRQYYPPLTHPLSHRPYSPRISRNRTALPHVRTYDGDYSSENEEIEHLRPPHDSQYTERVEELELQGSPLANAPDRVDEPLNLPEVWKQGQGMEVLPLGQARATPPQDADNRV